MILVHLLFSFAMAQDIRLRLLSHQPNVSVAGESLQIEGKDFKRVIITYHQKQNVWLVKDIHTQKTFGFKTKALEVEGEDVKVLSKKGDPKRLKSNFKLVWNHRGIDLVYPVPIETYLLGVLPSEMPPSWPIEALKAQAVASRSYALAQMQAQKTKHYDVDATVMDQVFNKEKFLSLSKELQTKIQKAVQATDKEVMFFNKRIFKAYFHSRCGGFTENPRTVWNDSWKWEGRKDPYCNLSDANNWSYQLTFEDLARHYSLDTKEKSGEIVKVVSGDRTASGRAENIFLFFKDGRIRRWSSQNLREKTGFANIKSTLFDLSVENAVITFKGKGFGHGVGLCQHGARQMARLGKKHHEILSFYYPKADLRAVFHWPSFMAKLQGNPL